VTKYSLSPIRRLKSSNLFPLHVFGIWFPLAIAGGLTPQPQPAGQPSPCAVFAMAAAGPIKSVPGPWKCKVQCYVIAWFGGSRDPLPAVAYSPLEAASSFAGPASGLRDGGFQNIQIVRYSESPVGAYDEILICPGAFKYPVVKDGKVRERRNLRITRIYVSTKESAYNGRKGECIRTSAHHEMAD
jgi:hypothetical protein